MNEHIVVRHSDKCLFKLSSDLASQLVERCVFGFVFTCFRLNLYRPIPLIIKQITQLINMLLACDWI